MEGEKLSRDAGRHEAFVGAEGMVNSSNHHHEARSVRVSSNDGGQTTPTFKEKSNGLQEVGVVGEGRTRDSLNSF